MGGGGADFWLLRSVGAAAGGSRLQLAADSPGSSSSRSTHLAKTRRTPTHARAIVTAEKALFFEPSGVQTRRLLDLVIPRLQASAGARLAARQKAGGGGGSSGSSNGDGEVDTYLREANGGKGDASAKTPFELDVLEGVLMVTTGEGRRLTRFGGLSMTEAAVACSRPCPQYHIPNSTRHPPPPPPPPQAAWSAR